jgi:hypothetical protein
MSLLEDPVRRPLVINAARAIASRSPRPCSTAALHELLAATPKGRKARAGAHDEVVKDRGNPLFRIKHQRRSIAIVVPVEKISASTLVEIREAITGILRDNSEAVAVSSNSNSRIISAERTGHLGSCHTALLQAEDSRPQGT